ncbi:MAG: prolipoprotein diacylglyceryl transferase [Christensenellales bacterium]|jgi:phosphatidylglycerol:prolipoprotein diacylglycerol transferase
MHWTGKVQPIAFSIFGRDVAWYGIIITSAILIGMLFSMKRCQKIKMTTDDFLEIFLWAVPLAIVCGRIGYVIYKASDYFVPNFGWSDFVNLIAVWEGGITIVGAVPGGAIGLYLWCKYRKVDFISVADQILPLLLIGQAIGRWGNFFNQEIYGPVVSNPSLQFFPYAVFIEYTGQFHNALFFYESMLDLIAFLVLFYVMKRFIMRYNGILLYAGTYSFIRFVMEFLRLDFADYPVDPLQIAMFIISATCWTLLVLQIKKAKAAGKRVWYKDGVPLKLYTDAKKQYVN